MANTDRQKTSNDNQIDDVDQGDRVLDRDDSSYDSSSSTAGDSSIAVGDGEGDLLVQREDKILQFLQALDMQVMGACRADERLKPLLKLNASSGAVEDRLLSQLSQHFEPSEVGMLARCLCMPLVSIRVGKINRQGTLFYPTSTRGKLNLMLLPTSAIRILFIGDEGHAERLATLTNEARCSAVEIEEILTDKSGRSFLISIPDGETYYFWCSEKSGLLGKELLRKMRDLLQRKPSLAELTGISDSRLNCFAIHLRAYLAESMITGGQTSSILSTAFVDSSVDFPESNHTPSFSSAKTSRSRQCFSPGAKANPIYQGSLSPRSSSFKEGMLRSSPSLRTSAREKISRRRGLSTISCVTGSTTIPTSGDLSSPSSSEKEKQSEATGKNLVPSLSFLEALGSADAPFSSSESQVSTLGSPHFSPHYCWCPPVASALQYTVGASRLPVSLTESSSLPPISSLSSSRSSGLLIPNPVHNLSELPPVDFPPLLPESLVRLPLTMPSSKQIPTFTPLICDPIVHIPVIDVCSSGQGYLVSAGPAISTAIPPLSPCLVNPLIGDAGSVVEKSARETLRMLINSSNQSSPQLLDVYPSVLSNSNEPQNSFATGSRGLYSGTRDVDAISNSMSCMDLASYSGLSLGSDIGSSREASVDVKRKPLGPSGSDAADYSSKLSDENAD